MHRTTFLLAGGALALAIVAGCSSERTVVRRDTETVVQPMTPAVQQRTTTVETLSPADEETTTVVKKRTTQVESE